MLVRPLPGKSREIVTEVIRQVAADLTNARGALGDAYMEYIRWANLAALRLRAVLSADDIERLVLTRRHWTIQGLAGQAGTPPVISLVNAEFDERTFVFDEVQRMLREQISKWSRAGVVIVPDTSFYIRSPEKVDEVDFNGLADANGAPVHVVVPILVVDELDRLKQASVQHTRWRAGYTLAVFDEVLSDPSRPALLQTTDPVVARGGRPVPWGGVTIEVVLDPPGHVRLPLEDDELIDRALAVQAFVGDEVAFVTYDTGQSMRARAAGLTCIKLVDDPGEEPAPRELKRTRPSEGDGSKTPAPPPELS